MKKRIILFPSEFERVPLEWIRIYAEMLIKEIPKYSKSFQDDDAYRIFFPKNACRKFNLKTRKRIFFFQGGVMIALLKTFGTKVIADDVALIFRYKNGNNVRSILLRTTKQQRSLANFLRKKLEVIIANAEDSHFQFLKMPEGYTLINTIIDRKEVRILVPDEYFEFSKRLYEALSEESEIGFSKEILRSRNRKVEVISAKTIFIVVFSRKFPDVTTKFLAYLLNYGDHSTIVNLYDKAHWLFSSINRNTQEARDFLRLVDKIKVRCEII